MDVIVRVANDHPTKAIQLPTHISVSQLATILNTHSPFDEPRRRDADAWSAKISTLNGSTMLKTNQSLGSITVYDGDAIEFVPHFVQQRVRDPESPRAGRGKQSKRRVGKVKRPMLVSANGRELPLRGHRPIIGRYSPPDKKPDIDISRFDSRGIISRRHAQITLSSGEYTIQDLDSANGTFVNGHEIEPFERVQLLDQTEIQFGESGPKFTFHLPD